ncbi:MAG: hypothetical protein HUJ65_00100, partial [Oscillospiraceae bacterium]|nr:hypothetical protein [Oscillospiraceae bacterium]
FKFYAIISFAVPFLVIGLPLFDTAFAFFRRLLTGRNPMSPDRGHVHHRLIDMGLSQKQTVVVLYTISAVLGLAAVLITTSGEMRALLFVVAIVITLVIAGVIVRGHHHHKSDAEAHAENHDDSVDASGCHGDNSDEH